MIKSLHLVPDDDPSVSELLQLLCGILDVNCFELRSPGGLDGLLLRGLYVEASLMAHDCRGNTHLTADDNFQLTVYASLPIKEGDEIYFNYTSSLLVCLFAYYKDFYFAKSKSLRVRNFVKSLKYYYTTLYYVRSF